MTSHRHKPQSRPSALALICVLAFSAGAALMSFELVGSRILAPYFGNSIFVWGSLIGVFLAALAIGYAVGGRVADRWPTTTALSIILAGASILVGIDVLVSEPVQRAVVHLNPGVRLAPLLSAAVLFAPASILMGMVSPYAVRLAAPEAGHVGRTAGMLYGISTTGSIVGTIATAFWLIPATGTMNLVLIAGVVLALCAFACALAQARVAGLIASGVAILACGVLALNGSGSSPTTQSRSVGNWSPVLRAGNYHEPFKPEADGKIRQEVDSHYHRIRVVDYPGGIGAVGPTRIMHFDNSIQAGTALNSKGQVTGVTMPLFRYLRAFDLVPIVEPHARRVLMLGLGSGASAMRLHALMPDARIDVVEIDPAVLAAARRWFGFDDRAIHVHIGDARSWLAASNDTFDVIVADTYYADSIPFHLTTQQFVDVVDAHLADHGVVAINSIGALEGRKSRLLRSFIRTWRGTFEDVAAFAVPDMSGHVDLTAFGNVELFASHEAFPSPERIRRAIDASPLKGRIDDKILQGILANRYQHAIDVHDVPTLTDDFAPVDSLVSVSADAN